MARARNIKPGFFRNADLVELSFESRLLFIGLWTLADRSGRLEDKPKQIKMEIFPADNIDCNALLDDLASTGMLARYEVDGKRYLQVVNFAKHQNPHRDEKASTIPAQFEEQEEAVKPDANTVQAPCNTDARTVAIVLNPDVLIPDSLIPDASTKKTPPRKRSASVEAKPDDVEQQTWDDWVALRAKKRTTVSKTVIDEARRESIKADLTLERFLQIWCLRGSQGLQAEWIKPHERGLASETFKERDAREGRRRWEEMTGQTHPDNLPKNIIDVIEPMLELTHVESN